MMSNPLTEYATTERQKQILQLRGSHSEREIAEKLGLTVGQVTNAVRTVRNIASRRGWSPEHDVTHPTAPGQYLKGTSTLYDDDGNVKIQWVKTNADMDRMQEFAIQLAESTAETVKPLKPVKQTKGPKDTKRMPVYVLPDLHLGLLCGEDSGSEWDSVKAEEVLTEMYQDILERSPITETCLIAQLGDLLHADNYSASTPKSGHHLDVSERWSESIKIGLRMLRKMIDAALKRHDQVNVNCLSGNHDVCSGYMLAIAIDALYSNEPRVDICTSSKVHQYRQFGSCLLGMTHGDKGAKPDRLYQCMAEDCRDIWSEVKHLHYFSGHLHSMKAQDVGSMTVETFRAPIPGDSYARGEGYRSSRSLSAVVFHEEKGEVSRAVSRA